MTNHDTLKIIRHIINAAKPGEQVADIERVKLHQAPHASAMMRCKYKEAKLLLKIQGLLVKAGINEN